MASKTTFWSHSLIKSPPSEDNLQVH
jgi:hypothetical protein